MALIFRILLTDGRRILGYPRPVKSSKVATSGRSSIDMSSLPCVCVCGPNMCLPGRVVFRPIFCCYDDDDVLDILHPPKEHSAREMSKLHPISYKL